MKIISPIYLQVCCMQTFFMAFVLRSTADTFCVCVFIQCGIPCWTAVYSEFYLKNNQLEYFFSKSSYGKFSIDGVSHSTKCHQSRVSVYKRFFSFFSSSFHQWNCINFDIWILPCPCNNSNNIQMQFLITIRMSIVLN